MLLDTNKVVSAKEFRAELPKYLRAAQRGGPIAVMQKDKVVGFFVAAEEYEAMYGAAIRRLLESRMSGPTVSHEEAQAHVRDVIRRHKKKQ